MAFAGSARNLPFLILAAVSFAASSCDNGRSPTVAPPPESLTGSWVGEAVVLDASPALSGCAYMGSSYPTGHSWPLQAEIAQEGSRVEIRLGGADLLRELVFGGDLEAGELQSVLDAQASEVDYPCSWSGFVHAQDVGGSFVARGVDEQLVGNMTIDFRRRDMNTGQFSGEEFAVPMSVSLRRAGNG